MLTDRQRWCFEQLGIPLDNEKLVRTNHKESVQQGRAVKDFTRYMVKRVHAYWRRSNSVPYLGD